MLTIHHLGVSQSERIIWLCEELGVPYELKKYDRDAQTRLAPAEYKALHPIGTAPIITDGNLVLPESGAIIEYINNKYGQGRLALKPDHPNYADYVFWFHFANGSMMPNMMMGLIATLSGANPAGNPIMESLLERSKKGFALMEARLAKVPYFAGDTFTAADVIMLFPLTTMRAFAPIDLSAYPSIRAYLKRIGERPAYLRAMKKGDPDLPLNLG
ncbi:MAG TPA: glutathione S-transferase [Nevskiaceae bacterium]|nr:glutathione S-transferase [Nevskiaceae bacterium]